MERIPGRQLCDVWPKMPEAERFGLVKSMVGIEAKLTTVKLSKYGSIYYRDDHPEGSTYEQPAGLTGYNSTDTSRFVIGPVTERHFWADGKLDLEIDRGPCKCFVSQGP